MAWGPWIDGFVYDAAGSVTYEQVWNFSREYETAYLATDLPSVFPGLVQEALDVVGVSGEPTPATAVFAGGGIHTEWDHSTFGTYPDQAAFARGGREWAMAVDASAARTAYTAFLDDIPWPDGAVDVEYESPLADYAGHATLQVRLQREASSGDVATTFQIRATDWTAADLQEPQMYTRSGDVLVEMASADLPVGSVVSGPTIDMSAYADPVTGEYVVKSAVVLTSVTVPTYEEHGDQTQFFTGGAGLPIFRCQAPRARYWFETAPSPLKVLTEDGWKKAIPVAGENGGQGRLKIRTASGWQTLIHNEEGVSPLKVWTGNGWESV